MLTKIKDNKIVSRLIALGLGFLMLIGIFFTSQATAEAAVVYGSYTNYQRAAIYYTYTQNADTCVTTLTVRLRVYSGSSSYGTYKKQAPWSLTYNGTTKTGTTSYTCPSANSYTNISDSYSTTITQTNGAAKSVSLSGWLNLSGTSVGGKLSVSSTITLPAFEPSTTYSSTSVSGEIIWEDDSDRDGKRPDSVTVTLYQNGTAYKTATVSTSSNDFSWSSLNTYASGGSTYTYTVAGSTVDGYTMSVSGTTITYNHTPATQTVAGTVVWDDDSNRDGKRPSSVDVTLLKNNATYETKTVESTNNTFSFADLYSYESGSKLSYTLTATDLSSIGYTRSISGNTVTYTYEPEMVDISGDITWDDDDDAQGIRPSVVEVTLLVNGSVYDTVTTSADEDWAYDFGSYYAYENGEEVVYTISVPEITDYTSTVRGFDVTYASVGRLGTIFMFSL